MGCYRLTVGPFGILSQMESVDSFIIGEFIAFCNSTDDMQARADKMFEAEQILVDEMVGIPLFQTSGYWGMKTYMSGITKCGLGANDPDFSRVHYDGEE